VSGSTPLLGGLPGKCQSTGLGESRIWTGGAQWTPGSPYLRPTAGAWQWLPEAPHVTLSKVHFLRFWAGRQPYETGWDQGLWSPVASMHGECGLVSPQIYLIAVRNPDQGPSPIEFTQYSGSWWIRFPCAAQSPYDPRRLLPPRRLERYISVDASSESFECSHPPAHYTPSPVFLISFPCSRTASFPFSTQQQIRLEV
jgi:hypothetical protein